MNERWNTYVVGNSNRDAHVVLTDILETPGKMNPVILWGPSATGKTKMVEDFAGAIKATGKTVCKKTYEEIIREMLNDIHNDDAKVYREKYHLYDYVIIDDLQFLVAKESTQWELTEFFDELITAGVQVVLVSSLSITNLSVIEEWSRSKGTATVIELLLPDIKMKEKALIAMSAKMNSNVPDEVIDYVSMRCKDFRRLEGGMHSILARRRVFNEQITVELAEAVLSDK